MTSTQLHQEYYNAKQLRLPLDYEVIIPYDSEARTFDEVFRRLEVKKYLVEGSPLGRTGYNPVNMLKLILFCQMEKIQSLREMEKAAKNDIRIMWLTEELKPSHQTIKTFMDKYLVEGIEEIFYDISRYFIEKEKIDTSKLYIDGTKIESMANKYTFVWKKSIIKFRTKLYKKITKTIEQLNEEYETERIVFSTRDSYKIEELKKITRFLEKEIKQANIEFVSGKGSRKTQKQRIYEKLVEYIDKLESYLRDIEIMGSERNSYSKTDSDATFMHMKEDHMRNSQLKPGYNIQIGVSDEYILHLDIFKERNDYKTLIPFLEGYQQRYQKYPIYPVADAGYGGLVNYRYMKFNDMKLCQKYNLYAKDTDPKTKKKDAYFTHTLIKDGKDYVTPSGEKLIYMESNYRGNDVYLLPNGKTKEINDENLAYQKEVISLLTSPLGIELRTQRSIQVEGAFGVIKEVFKVRRFRRKGTNNVRLEFFLTAIGYNLSKYHHKLYRITD